MHFSKLDFTRYKAEQPLQDMELQERLSQLLAYCACTQNLEFGNGSVNCRCSKITVWESRPWNCSEKRLNSLYILTLPDVC